VKSGKYFDNNVSVDFLLVAAPSWISSIPQVLAVKAL